MDRLTRRKFLVASGTAGVATAAIAACGYLTWPTLAGQAIANPLAMGTPILVIVTLYGGNDGLNTVIPYQDPVYLRARRDFGYSANDVLPLDDHLGLNPALPGLADLWHRQQLAVIRGVGYPKPDHSHFRSMDIWQTASPQAPVSTGWIGRWLDHTGDNPARAVSIGSVLPPLAVGAKSAAASLPLGAQAPLPADLAAAFSGLHAADPTDTAAQRMVVASYGAERSVAATFAPVTDPAQSPEPDQESAGGSAGAQSNLQQQLNLVARCVKARVPTTAYSVSLGGFDTHAGEKQTQEAQLRVLDTALSGFLSSLATDPAGRHVVVMVYSEFGRRVEANSSQGTDHGTAGPVFVAGVPVRGGFYGDQPSLTDLDDGDLKASVDFRTVYAELLSTTLRADPVPIVGTTAKPLGFLS